MGRIQTPRNQPTGPQLTLGGALSLGVFSVGLVSIATAFEASAWAGGVLLAGVIVALFFAGLAGAKVARVDLALGLFLAAAAWSLFAGLIVFEWHWLAFTPAAWLFDGLFVAALITGAWKMLESWGRILAALTAAALVTATVVLPRPPGGDGAFDTAAKWKVNVAAADQADNAPLEGAQVLCGTAMQWESALTLADVGARTTNRDGRAEPWEFEEDPRLKVVICNVWKGADEANAGYAPQTQVVLAPAGGGEYTLNFALNEGSHPDTAFIEFDISGYFQTMPWYSLTFELWDGEPQGNVNDGGGAQPLVRKQWGQLHGGATALTAGVAQRDLTLRYRYESPAEPGLRPPALETHIVHLGPIAIGSRRRVALTIPSPQ